eukprot:364287-Chlamydomonas_euryale.AAC.5
MRAACEPSGSARRWSMHIRPRETSPEASTALQDLLEEVAMGQCGAGGSGASVQGGRNGSAAASAGPAAAAAAAQQRRLPQAPLHLRPRHENGSGDGNDGAGSREMEQASMPVGRASLASGRAALTSPQQQQQQGQQQQQQQGQQQQQAQQQGSSQGVHVLRQARALEAAPRYRSGGRMVLPIALAMAGMSHGDGRSYGSHGSSTRGSLDAGGGGGCWCPPSPRRLLREVHEAASVLGMSATVQGKPAPARTDAQQTTAHADAQHTPQQLPQQTPQQHTPQQLSQQRPADSPHACAPEQSLVSPSTPPAPTKEPAPATLSTPCVQLGSDALAGEQDGTDASAAATAAVAAGAGVAAQAATTAVAGSASAGGLAASQAPPAAAAAAAHYSAKAPPARRESGGLPSASSCVVCMGARAVLGLRHGRSVHVCVCVRCAERLVENAPVPPDSVRCPLCRQPVDEVLAVY